MEFLRTNLPEDALPVRSDEVGYGFLIADGIGGGQAGEVASRTAIQGIVELVLDVPDWILRPEGDWAELAMLRAADRHRSLPSVLGAQAESSPELQGMGTTLTVAYSVGLELFIAHVGDSRVYLFRAGKLFQLTTDHTWAQEMADAGLLPPQQIATHRLRHRLTRAITADMPGAEPEVQRLGLVDRDLLLLCTDGLTEMVSKDQIATVLASPANAEEQVARLLELALEGGGKDNVTALVAQYRVAASD